MREKLVKNQVKTTERQLKGKRELNKSRKPSKEAR